MNPQKKFGNDKSVEGKVKVKGKGQVKVKVEVKLR